MPQKVLCNACGEILYQGDDLKSPEEIYEMLGGRCPRCGRKISLMPQKVEILPVRDAISREDKFSSLNKR